MAHFAYNIILPLVTRVRLLPRERGYYRANERGYFTAGARVYIWDSFYQEKGTSTPITMVNCSVCSERIKKPCAHMIAAVQKDIELELMATTLSDAIANRIAAIDQSQETE